VDIPAEWVSDDFSALFIDKRQLGAPNVVVAATAALSGEEGLEFVRAEMTTSGSATTWEVLAVTKDLLVQVKARRKTQDWHAGNERAHDHTEAVVSGSARPLADAIRLDVADIRLRQFGDAWVMGCKTSVTLADGEVLTIVTDTHERSGDQFRQLFNVLGRAISASETFRSPES
jgi:hypothetical protein